jgi:hypothetical protein
MASTLAFSETYGTSPGTTTDTTYVNLLSTDTASGSDTTTNTLAAPITIPGAGTAYSYERWVRGHWTGTFTSISNVLFWKQSGTPDTGENIYGGDQGDQVYSTPVNTVSSVATSDSADWDTEGEAFSLAYSSNYSDYVVLQHRIGSTASQGYTPTITYRIGWDEV